MKKLLLIAFVYCICIMQSKAQWGTSGNAARTSDFLGTTNGNPLNIYVTSTAPVSNPIMTLDATYNILMGFNNHLYYSSGANNILSGDNNAIYGDGSAENCHAIGNNNSFFITQNYLNNSFMFGNDNTNNSVFAFLIGNENYAPSAPYSFGIGNNLLLNNPAGNVFAIGSNIQNTVSNSLIVGFNGYSTLFVGPTSVGIGTTAPVSSLHSNGVVSIGTYSTLSPYSGVLNINTSYLGQGHGIIVENDFLSSKSRINILAPTTGVNKGGLSFDMTNNAFSTVNHSLFLADDGTVGFGTQNPVSSIHTTGSVYIGTYGQANTYNTALNINSGNGIMFERNDGYYDNVKAKIGISISGLRFLVTRDGFTGSSTDPQWGNEGLMLAGNGNVGIGTAGPVNKLDVAGTIRAYRVKVETGWSDYVFKTDYKLMPLQEVEKYIQTNSHLPEIPSEKDIAEKGLDLGDMQALHMKKIEELTLYIIELRKEIEILKVKVNKE